jgi:hypothetical protein
MTLRFLLRPIEGVMVHGVLHYCDIKTRARRMNRNAPRKTRMALFHVEQ